MISNSRRKEKQMHDTQISDFVYNQSCRTKEREREKKERKNIDE